jgi:hypothetical protein
MEPDHFRVSCPYCGEEMEIFVEPDVDGEWVQDCEVCCNPWQVYVVDDGRRRRIRVHRSDGGDL